ncbi:hypothetical protein CDAR_174531 [Caerostris darwini]|uniref:Uncharacterized protein n=1 Tax=Caerostris darwini TaxID=1538125 RepID=A0AAV4PG71_9ARAC|nr:hypothetical protein CDAR_174531 [Caerostris darwini]
MSTDTFQLTSGGRSLGAPHVTGKTDYAEEKSSKDNDIYRHNYLEIKDMNEKCCNYVQKHQNSISSSEVLHNHIYTIRVAGNYPHIHYVFSFRKNLISSVYVQKLQIQPCVGFPVSNVRSVLPQHLKSRPSLNSCATDSGPFQFTGAESSRKQERGQNFDSCYFSVSYDDENVFRKERLKVK